MFFCLYLFVKFLKPYTNIKNFLYRFTIFQIGNLHIRIHKIVDDDKTTLLHNHPFNYISIILKGGYTDVLEDKTYNYGWLSIIKRKHEQYHRIINVKKNTYTLFIAYGKYEWNAKNINKNGISGIFQRNLNNRTIWAKRENNIWFIGNENKEIAIKETKHSIHQI